MDNGIPRTLRTLPDDLADLGWRLVSNPRAPLKRVSGTVYQVIYERPFEQGVDDDSKVGIIRRLNHIRVSKKSKDSWTDAYQLAIEEMRTIDAQRKS